MPNVFQKAVDSWRDMLSPRSQVGINKINRHFLSIAQEQIIDFLHPQFDAAFDRLIEASIATTNQELRNQLYDCACNLLVQQVRVSLGLQSHHDSSFTGAQKNLKQKLLEAHTGDFKKTREVQSEFEGTLIDFDLLTPANRCLSEQCRRWIETNQYRLEKIAQKEGILKDKMPIFFKYINMLVGHSMRTPALTEMGEEFFVHAKEELDSIKPGLCKRLERFIPEAIARECPERGYN